jgi:hypothetical protein
MFFLHHFTDVTMCHDFKSLNSHDHMKKGIKKGIIILIEAFPDEHMRFMKLLVTNFRVSNIL